MEQLSEHFVCTNHKTCFVFNAIQELNWWMIVSILFQRDINSYIIRSSSRVTEVILLNENIYFVHLINIYFGPRNYKCGFLETYYGETFYCLC